MATPAKSRGWVRPDRRPMQCWPVQLNSRHAPMETSTAEWECRAQQSVAARALGGHSDIVNTGMESPATAHRGQSPT